MPYSQMFCLLRCRKTVEKDSRLLEHCKPCPGSWDELPIIHSIKVTVAKKGNGISSNLSA
jgi:hypothetical protein